MKRKTLKRKISIVGILVFVSMIVYSCWQDEWSSNVTDEVIFDSNKELTIAKAEQWYNATNPSATTVRSLSADGRIPAKPNWNKAKESRKGDLEVVETTLMTSGSTFFMDNETKEKYELQDDLDKIYNVVRMVILKNLETGEIYNFIMVFIGTYDYLMHTTSFENNSYLHRGADFDGKVLFYNFNYGLVNGWKYESGKITASISPGTEEGYRMSLQRGRVQSVCNTEIDWMKKRNCHNDIVWDHELGLPGIDVICDKYLHPEYHEVCVSLDDDEMGGGGGGYNPPSNPPETPPTPCKRAKTLSQDAAFKSRIKDVYRKTFSAGNTVEQGFIQTSDGQTIFPNVQESGSAKFTNDQIAGKEIMEWYHSHPTGSMITSWADLKALAIRYQQGYVKSENFTYGVVSEFGCMSIMITSPVDFNAFATKVRNGELSESWNAYIVGASGGGVDECIGQLLKFLDRNNSGLSVMFSSNIDESNPTWNAQELASNGKSVNMECNQ